MNDDYGEAHYEEFYPGDEEEESIPPFGTVGYETRDAVSSKFIDTVTQEMLDEEIMKKRKNVEKRTVKSPLKPIKINYKKLSEILGARNRELELKVTNLSVSVDELTYKLGVANEQRIAALNDAHRYEMQGKIATPVAYRWNDRTGKPVAVSSMGEPYLRNCISYVQRVLAARVSKVQYMSELKDLYQAMYELLAEAERRHLQV